MNNFLQSRRPKRVLALLLSLVIVMGYTTVLGYVAEPGYTADSSYTASSDYTADSSYAADTSYTEDSYYVADPGEYTYSQQDFTETYAAPAGMEFLSAGGTTYRNLNLTPGGNVSEMRFTWHSHSPVGGVRVYVAGDMSAPVAVANSSTQLLTSRSADTFYFPGVTPDYTVHQAIVTGLVGETNYVYVLTGAGWESAPKPFRTGSINDSFRFLAGGDPQIAVWVANRHRDRDGWTNTLEVATNNVPDAAFFLSVGDQIHTRNDYIHRSQYMYDILFAPLQFQNLPLVPVVGNHEAGAANFNGQLWHRHYGTLNPQNPGDTLGNTRRHGAQHIQFDYYVRWGNMIMIALDSNTRTWGGERLQWFEGVLNTHNDAEWRVVTFHHPPYSVYRFASDGAKQQIIANWMPEFERLNIDLILNGHCHSYSRSHQMLGNIPQLNQRWLDASGNIAQGTSVTNAVLDPTGIVVIALNSASGSGYYNVRGMAARDYIAAYNQNFHRNFSVVDVTNNTLSVATYQINNDDSLTLVDVYTIVRSDANGNVPAGVALPQMDSHNLIGGSDNLMSVTQPANIRDLPSYTQATAQALGLPTQVRIETTLSNNATGRPQEIRNPNDDYLRNARPIYASVTWNLDNISYDPSSGEEQSFDVTGTIVLPRGVVNTGNIPLTVTVNVTVGNEIPYRAALSNLGDVYHFNSRTHANFWYESFDPTVFTTWQSGPTTIGFGTGTGSLSTVLTPATPRHTWHYFSRMFTLPDNFCVERIVNIAGRHMIDDSLVLFINGVEVYRLNTSRTNADVIIGNPIDWGVFSGHNTNAILQTFNINTDNSAVDTGYPTIDGVNFHSAASRTNFEAAVRPGVNILTAAVGNNSATSSDIWFNLELFVEYLACECENGVVTEGTLTAVITPATPITGIAAGAPATQEGLGLPATVLIMAQVGNTATPFNANVIWDIAGSGYNPQTVTAQTVNISGTIILPEGITNPDSVSLAVTVQVQVSGSVFYLSQFGDYYYFYGRTHAEFLYDAFDPAAFRTWTRGRTAIGFGGPRSGHLTPSPATVIPIGAGPHQRGADGVHTFTYFSRTFTLPANFCVHSMGSVTGTHRLDDNMILFINGIEVYRANTGALNQIQPVNMFVPTNWAAYRGHNSDAQNRPFHINYDFNNRNMNVAAQANEGVTFRDAANRTNLLLALRPGENVLTAVVGNHSAGSSDLWFDLELLIEYGGCQCTSEMRSMRNYANQAIREVPAAMITSPDVFVNIIRGVAAQLDSRITVNWVGTPTFTPAQPGVEGSLLGTIVLAGPSQIPPHNTISINVPLNLTMPAIPVTANIEISQAYTEVGELHRRTIDVTTVGIDISTLQVFIQYTAQVGDVVGTFWTAVDAAPSITIFHSPNVTGIMAVLAEGVPQFITQDPGDVEALLAVHELPLSVNN